MEFQEIKTKRAWKRYLPSPYKLPVVCTDLEPQMNERRSPYMAISQSDFIEEFHASSHKINDPAYYPDIIREEIVEEIDDRGNPTGEVKTNRYIEYVPRYAFSFQQIITIKHLVHLFGNDTQTELLNDTPDEKMMETFGMYKTGWLDKNVDISLYEMGKSVLTTGDGAIVGYLNKGEFGTTTLSFANGDILYPHYDSVTGELTLFARGYYSRDENGNEIAEYLEVWDEKMFRRYRQDKLKTVVNRIKGIFGLQGFTLVEEKPHGFPFVPVAYFRDENGACWSEAQDSIDGFELSFSQMAHNNRAFGEPILYTKEGSNDGIQPSHDLNGTIKIMNMGKDDDAGYLQAESASESYQKQLDLNYKLIYEQTFTVVPPELKSGDLPAAALKILYSPAYEWAENKAKDLQPVLDKLGKIFSCGYGIETGKIFEFKELPVKHWIKPYVHVNESAVITDLSTAVINGFCSRQTAAERASFYTTNDEWDRLMKEQKEKQRQEMMMAEKSAQLKAKTTAANKSNTNNNNSNNQNGSKKESGANSDK